MKLSKAIIVYSHSICIYCRLQGFKKFKKSGVQTFRWEKSSISLCP